MAEFTRDLYRQYAAMRPSDRRDATFQLNQASVDRLIAELHEAQVAEVDRLTALVDDFGMSTALVIDPVLLTQYALRWVGLATGPFTLFGRPLEICEDVPDGELWIKWES